MISRLVPPTHAGDAFYCNPARRFRGRIHSFDSGRVSSCTDQYEIIVHQRDSLRSESFLDKLFFQGFGMDHDEINVAFPGDIQCRTCPGADMTDTDVPFLFNAFSRASIFPALIGPWS